MVDRLLVDLLVAVEYFTYAQHVRYGGRVRRPLSAYLLWRVWSALFFGAIMGGALLMTSYGIVGGEARMWTAIVCLALFGVDTVVTTVHLPSALVARAQGKGLATSGELLRLMELLYQALKSDGLISAFHIREQAKKADERGVGWPPTLFALLDDIAARSGRF
jgi:hypothetical protein